MIESKRHVIAILAAVASVILASFYTGNFFNNSLLPSVGRISGLSAILLGIGAFVLAIKLRSIPVGALLIASGVIIETPPIMALIAEHTIRIPGPILGVISYSVIVGLGISKMLTSTLMKEMLGPRPA